MSQNIPPTQYALQLVGPSQLRLNTAKEVHRPGPHQILARVECVGLCFSDLKLLKQFAQHPRKMEILRGLPPEVLAEIPSYVPGDKPTVPGHEATCRIVAVGEKVARHRVGERCLVQTDYRALPTSASNASFGYNFEGALQEYVLMDERVVIDPNTGERFLIPAPEHLSASSIALVEPWACVEDSYVNEERRAPRAGGQMLVMADPGRTLDGLAELVREHRPAHMACWCPDEAQREVLRAVHVPKTHGGEPPPEEAFDDIIYFGSDARVIEMLNDRLAARGIMNIVLGGRRIGRPVSVGVGRVHYGMTRWIGTTGTNAAESYGHIPATGELRAGERMLVIGAGGPMGQMHVIRAVCSGTDNLTVVGTDMDDARLEALRRKAAPMAARNGVHLRLVNTQKEPLAEKFSYFAIMAPVGALVAAAVRDSLPDAIINIFAGIPAPTRQEMDLDAYIERRCFMFGTSGSVIRDMKIVLAKLESGQLDTDASVDAVSGMAGAVDGMAAVENRTLAGKIIVYPSLHRLGLVPLSRLGEQLPTVAARLRDGMWCREAEAELLRVAQ